MSFYVLVNEADILTLTYFSSKNKILLVLVFLQLLSVVVLKTGLFFAC